MDQPSLLRTLICEGAAESKSESESEFPDKTHKQGNVCVTEAKGQFNITININNEK